MQGKVKQIPEAAKDSKFLIHFTNNLKVSVKNLDVGTGRFSFDDWMGRVRKMVGFRLADEGGFH